MVYKLLSQINKVEDLRKLPETSLPDLADELRRYIIDIVATKKGHLGAGLGVIELTIALHYSYRTPEDLLIWDVGHQAYAHKILTGRKDAFKTNRQLGGIAGFPTRSESVFDTFGTGHSSTSISALLAMAYASKLSGLKRKHIAVIGDASIASGMAFEALNHAGVSHTDILIILNDNEMGIDPHVGALKEYLTRIKTDTKEPGSNIFEDLNFQYFGPVDGHDIHALLSMLKRLQKIKGAKLLHIITTKGKGLPPAERDQVTYHAPGIFDKTTGLLKPEIDKDIPPKFQDVFGLSLLELAEENKKIIGITPAMPTGTSLKYMLEAFPERAFDVGIAEQHAITFAAGWATQNFTPYVAIYSTFLQRAYDQVIHDVALQNLPVVFCIDRAGIVGNDGATHHGVFDIAFLSAIPNMIIAVPADEWDLRNLLYTAQFTKSPFAIRYPRGRGFRVNWKNEFRKIPIGKARLLQEGKELAVLSTGPFTKVVQDILEENPGWSIAHYNFLFVKPLDTESMQSILQKYNKIITLEDAVATGGFGSAVLAFAATCKTNPVSIKVIGIPDAFVPHGSVDELFALLGMDKAGLLQTIKDFLS